MFEDSLVISQIQSVSSTGRWTALASISLQFSLAAFIIALPLLHPERLAYRVDAPHLLMPLPPKPPVSVEHIQTSAVISAAAFPLVPRAPMIPSLLHKLLPQVDNGPSISPIPASMEMNVGIPKELAIGDATHRPSIAIVPARATSGPVRISSGVSAGMLLTPIRPVYPNIARIANVEGTVIVEAVISRTGTIESLRAVSGPAMLRQAALTAISGARYQPYRLNGDPTEVQTTITVNFQLAH